MVNLDRCNGSFNTLDDPSGRICVANKAKYINIDVFDKYFLYGNKNK